MPACQGLGAVPRTRVPAHGAGPRSMVIARATNTGTRTQGQDAARPSSRPQRSPRGTQRRKILTFCENPKSFARDNPHFVPSWGHLYQRGFLEARTDHTRKRAVCEGESRHHNPSEQNGLRTQCSGFRPSFSRVLNFFL